jgi:hypothetical protein
MVAPKSPTGRRWGQLDGRCVGLHFGVSGSEYNGHGIWVMFVVSAVAACALCVYGRIIGIGFVAPGSVGRISVDDAASARCCYCTRWTAHALLVDSECFYSIGISSRPFVGCSYRTRASSNTVLRQRPTWRLQTMHAITPRHPITQT